MVKVGDSFLIIHTTFCYSGTCYYRKCQVFFYRLDDLQLRKVKRNLEFHFGLIAQKKRAYENLGRVEMSTAETHGLSLFTI